MERNKRFIIILLIIAVIPLVSARQGQTVGTVGRIYMSVLNASGSASETATCTTDVRYTLNGTLLYDDESLTHEVNGQYYFNTTSTWAVGVYRSDVTCTLGTLVMTKSFMFDISAKTEEGWRGVWSDIEGYISNLPAVKNLLERLLLVEQDTLDFMMRVEEYPRYHIQVSNGSNFDWINLETRVWYSDYTIDTDNLPNDIYYWHVRVATGNAGFGVWSNAWSINVSR